jgi:hypothetical protein
LPTKNEIFVYVFTDATSINWTNIPKKQAKKHPFIFLSKNSYLLKTVQKSETTQNNNQKNKTAKTKKQRFLSAFQPLNKGGGSHRRAHYRHPCSTMRLFQPTIFLFKSQPRVPLAGVAERFRRQPAELLYMGSTPIPSFQ